MAPFYFILFHSMLSYAILSYSISFYLVSFHFILLHFISFYLYFIFIIFYFILSARRRAAPEGPGVVWEDLERARPSEPAGGPRLPAAQRPGLAAPRPEPSLSLKSDV